MQAPVVLITGGSRGIGAAVALQSAKAGYDVVLTYQTEQAPADAICDQITALGRRALALKADVAREADVLAVYAALDEQFGRLDALVNNAGTVEPAQPFHEYSAQRIERLLSVNILGAFLVAREAVKRLSIDLGGRGGSIVNISSVAAKLGAPNEYIDYAATKGALDTLTVGLAKELAGQGVRVNSVRPGLIDTEIHARGGRPERIAQLSPSLPFGRAGTPDEVATGVLYLMSPEASYVSGTLLDIAGAR
ncbi:MAG: SDR family oxidoreductase [Burkholderiaceae bacterium]